MDNQTRSERTRAAVLEAALTIIARDGPGRITLDAIARECGLSKGGVLHQFRTKEAVLRALLERQMASGQDFSAAFLAENQAAYKYPALASQIATMRDATSHSRSLVFAVLAAAAQDPDLLSPTRDAFAATTETVAKEADHPDVALLRWVASSGLVIMQLLGVSPLAPEQVQRLFDLLMDESGWDKAGQSFTRQKDPA